MESKQNTGTTMTLECKEPTGTMMTPECKIVCFKYLMLTLRNDLAYYNSKMTKARVVADLVALFKSKEAAGYLKKSAVTLVWCPDASLVELKSLANKCKENVYNCMTLMIHQSIGMYDAPMTEAKVMANLDQMLHSTKVMSCLLRHKAIVPTDSEKINGTTTTTPERKRVCLKYYALALRDHMGYYDYGMTKAQVEADLVTLSKSLKMSGATLILMPDPFPIEYKSLARKCQENIYNLSVLLERREIELYDGWMTETKVEADLRRMQDSSEIMKCLVKHIPGL